MAEPGLERIFEKARGVMMSPSERIAAWQMIEIRTNHFGINSALKGEPIIAIPEEH